MKMKILCKIFGHKYRLRLGWSDWIIKTKCFRCGHWKDGRTHDEREIEPILIIN